MGHRLSLTGLSIGVLCFVLVSFLSAATAPAEESFVWRSIPHEAFGSGERIVYTVKYGALAGGAASQKILGVEDVGGRKAFHIVSEAQSNKTFSTILKVRERRDSWVDTQSLSSLKLVEDLKEGSYERKSETRVDPSQGKLGYTYKTKKHQGTNDIAVDPYIQDSVSLVYYLRTLPLESGKSYDVPLHLGGNAHVARIRVKGVEKIKVPAGSFECYHLIPTLVDDTKSDWSLEVWLTTAPRRLPVLLKSKIAVGSFTARMSDYTPGTEDQK
jgi:hypothetical protein